MKNVSTPRKTAVLLGLLFVFDDLMTTKGKYDLLEHTIKETQLVKINSNYMVRINAW
jgi:hypothetical protein